MSQNLGDVTLVVDEHRQYLTVPFRLEPFSCVTSTVVHPGSILLDLASGMGILGLMACRAGAARDYTVEVITRYAL